MNHIDFLWWIILFNSLIVDLHIFNSFVQFIISFLPNYFFAFLYFLWYSLFFVCRKRDLLIFECLNYFWLFCRRNSWMTYFILIKRFDILKFFPCSCGFANSRLFLLLNIIFKFFIIVFLQIFFLAVVIVRLILNLFFYNLIFLILAWLDGSFIDICFLHCFCKCLHCLLG